MPKDYFLNLTILVLMQIPVYTAQIASMFWNTFLMLIREHLIFSFIFLFILFALAFLKALNGSSRVLGSLLYTCSFFIGLFILWLIFGDSVLANQYVDLFLGITCFAFVGFLLRKIGIWRY